MTLSASRPIAAASGLPPKVEPCEPGVKTSVTSRARDERRDRHHAAAQRLAEDKAVRNDALVLEGEHLARAPEPGLDLIEDEQDVVLVAEASEASQKAGRRHDDAGLALDRLDQNGDGVLGDGALESGEIAERHGAEAGRKRAEAVAVAGLGREADDGGGAAVEIALGNDDLGVIAL